MSVLRPLSCLPVREPAEREGGRECSEPRDQPTKGSTVQIFVRGTGVSSSRRSVSGRRPLPNHSQGDHCLSLSESLSHAPVISLFRGTTGGNHSVVETKVFP